MKNMLTFYRETAERSRGQALVVIAVSFVALLLFVGLAIDGGMLLVNYGNLRRSVDAASLAAASQVRESTGTFDIENVAKSTMQLNGVTAATVTVKTCEDTTGTPQSFIDGCTQAVPRKLVYVSGLINSPTAFMSLIGFSSVPLSAWAVGEAAALDVIMVIDVSDSMAGRTSDADTYYRTTTEPVGDWSENPAYCNAEGSTIPPDEPCMPFHFVKGAAVGFAQNVLDKNFADPLEEDEDRMAIVTFAVGYDSGYTTNHLIAGTDQFSSDYSDVAATINSLSVYPAAGVCDHTSGAIPPHIGKCRREDLAPDFSYECAPAFAGPAGPGQYDGANAAPQDVDLSTCGTTSIGSGLLIAANLLGTSSTERPNAVRVVILLTDGANNASAPKAGDCTGTCDPTQIHNLLVTTPEEDHYFGYCPEGGSDYFCTDDSVLTRNIPDITPGNWDECPMLVRGDGSTPAGECPTGYDADDFAMDLAEFVGCPSILPAGSNCREAGQGAVMFTIGMGAQVSSGSTDASGRPYGVYMLRYIAEVGEDGDPLDTTSAGCTGDCTIAFDGVQDSCDGLYDNQTEFETNCGNYYFAQDAQSLGPVFEAIAARIFTRIAQ